MKNEFSITDFVFPLFAFKGIFLAFCATKHSQLIEVIYTSRLETIVKHFIHLIYSFRNCVTFIVVILKFSFFTEVVINLITLLKKAEYWFLRCIAI